MLYFSKAKIFIILVILTAGLFFAAPNAFDSKTYDKLPNFLPSGSLHLGLDLQGGSHLLLEVDVDAILQERLDTLLSEIRLALRKARIAYRNLSIKDGAIQITIRDTGRTKETYEVLNALSVPVVSNLFNANATNELVIASRGTGSFVIELSEDAIQARNRKAVEQSIEIVRRRIDELGTTEPSIQRQGDVRILVQVPGLDDPERLKSLLGQTAKLNFHLVDQNVSAYDVLNGARLPTGAKLLYTDTSPNIPYVIRKRVMVSGERLVDASVGFDPQTGAPEVDFRFDAVGGKQFGNVTKANVGKPFAIVLDDKIISAPVIQTAILGGSGRITGSFTVEEANNLAILLRAGALPAPLQILEERTVGPGLGADSIKAGSRASIIGFALVIGFILISYSLFGLFANIALILNMILIIGVLSALQATLTLPGIAGIVLTVGMAVDANVLIFERIREELHAGKAAIQAIDFGYSRALGTILDANITTLIAAFILFYLGSGPIRGFAVTLGVGIVTSVFTAFTVTRLMVALWVRRNADTIRNPENVNVPV